MIDQFASDVLAGLRAEPKWLPSKYFYDPTGDRLFQQIMELDEYYLTRTEYAILDTYKQEMLELFGNDGTPFNLIEFGAGDGYKTKILLNHFLKEKADFTYMPIDISGHALDELTRNLNEELPSLEVKGIENDYFKALDELRYEGRRNVVLFLGSNIGNFTGEQAHLFLEQLYASLRTGDMVMIGFDLKKNPDLILAAYDDSQGVTRDFNLNLLKRINESLDGNFDLSAFKHHATYNPLTGTTSSYLVSTREQIVEIMDAAIHFRPWEAIHMEISQKYDERMIEDLAMTSGFAIVKHFSDVNSYYFDSVWMKK